MENNNWLEISKEVSDVTKKIKNKVDNEDLVDDLKDSLKETIWLNNFVLSNPLFNPCLCRFAPMNHIDIKFIWYPNSLISLVQRRL